MKIWFFVIFLAVIISCKKDDDNPVNPYPVVYSFDRIDQTNEGLYLINAQKALVSLSPGTGLFGAYKDSLKTELKNAVSSQLDLQEIELTSASELKLHYTFQGFMAVTPVQYTRPDGVITLQDTLFSSLVTYDKTADAFSICGVTAIALPGPNVQVNPFGPPYFQVDPKPCIQGHSSQDYASDLLIAKNLQPLDTIGVLLTEYIYSKE